MMNEEAVAMFGDFPLDIPLIAHQIRIVARADTDIHFSAFIGSALRGALAGVLQRQYCPEWRNEHTDTLHRQLCPVCQLLGWEQEDIDGGDLRRPYGLLPPVDAATTYGAGECFSFGLTLFGARQHLLPYLILGVTAMGSQGVGQPDRQGARGRFTVVGLEAINPLTGSRRTLLGEGNAVRLETLPVTHGDVLAVAGRMANVLEFSSASGESASGESVTGAAAREAGPTVHLHFQTPLRLNQDRQLVKQPAFFPLIKQIVLRVLDLCVQHGDGRPNVILARDIYPHADQVTLVSDQTRWWEVAGYSHRLGRAQQLSGLVGEAAYVAPNWKPLLPWLVWGQITQVGKNTVKGCGVYRAFIA